MTTISQIKEAIGVGARPNLFKVEISGGSFASAEAFQFLCKAAQLPGSTVGSIEVPHVGGRRLKLAGDRTFTDWTVTILNDENFTVRKELERIQKSIVESDYDVNNSFGNQASINEGGINNITLTVTQLGEDGGAKRKYTLYNCFASEIAQIDLSYDSTDTIEEYSVTWQYDYFDFSSL
jgi:hypothetical protein